MCLYAGASAIKKQQAVDNAKAKRALVGPYIAKLTRDMTGNQDKLCYVLVCVSITLLCTH